MIPTSFIITNESMFSKYAVTRSLHLDNLKLDGKVVLEGYEGSQLADFQPPIKELTHNGEATLETPSVPTPLATLGGDITITISYQTWPFGFKKSQSFRFTSSEGRVGFLHWYPQPPTK
jgi:hypothetical protein